MLSGRAELDGAAGEAVLSTEVLTAGEALHFLPGTVCTACVRLEDTHILEASTPHLDDVVRLEARAWPRRHVGVARIAARLGRDPVERGFNGYYETIRRA